METWLAVLWVVLCSAFAWLSGWQSGMRYTVRTLAKVSVACGIRDLDYDTRTVTFSDGSTRTERAP